MKKLLVMILCVALVCPMFSASAENVESENADSAIVEQLIPCDATVEDDFVTGEIMVGIKAAYSVVNKVWTAADFPQLSGIVSIEDLTYAESADIVDDYSNNADFRQMLKIELSNVSKSSVINGISALEQNEKILFAEPNFIIPFEDPSQENAGIALTGALAVNNTNRYKKFTTDLHLELQDGIFLHNVDKVWNAFTKGSSDVVVGVIDDGIYQHEDLSSNLIQGYRCDTQTNDTSYSYTGNHGTGVASVIGARGNNSVGISGTCQRVSLYSLRVTNTNGEATTESFAQAYLKANVENIPIVNCSWYYGDEALIKTAMSMYNGLIVSTSGNDGIEINATNLFYPAYWNLENVIITGGVNADGTRDTTKNYSKTYVDLMALSNYVYACDSPLAGGSYSYWDGTSVAAPFVAGVAALLLSYDNTLTAAQLKQYILDGVHTTSALEDYCSTGGYLDAYGAFLEMLDVQPKSLNLQVHQLQPNGQHETSMVYEFEVYHQKPYARLTEIVIPSIVTADENMLGVDMTFTSTSVTVSLVMNEVDLGTSPIMEFHFITYETITSGKVYISLLTEQIRNFDGEIVNSNLPYYKALVGDANLDGTVNITDQTLVQQYVSGTATLTTEKKASADVDGNFSVELFDAIKIGQYNVGTIKSFY